MGNYNLNIMSDQEDELDWLHDYIVQFLKSPSFKIPLVTFIDENCVIFDEDEENKLTYTDIHTKFKTLVEDLIDYHLNDVQVTEEQFVKACNITKNPEDKKIFDQILAVDNFTAFKKLMINRNKELEMEALKMLSREESSVENASIINNRAKKKHKETNKTNKTSIMSEEDKEIMKEIDM